jgi:hypothetical protein
MLLHSLFESGNRPTSTNVFIAEMGALASIRIFILLYLLPLKISGSAPLAAIIPIAEGLLPLRIQNWCQAENAEKLFATPGLAMDGLSALQIFECGDD